MNFFDVVVIGAGPAGYVAAIRAAQLNHKVAIIDKKWLGGVCLNIGCIPSKSLLKNAEVAHTLRERGKEFGFSFNDLKLDYSVAVKRSRQVSTRLVKGVEFLMKKNGITTFIGDAKIVTNDTVVINTGNGELTEVKTKNIIIATGAKSSVPPQWEIDGKKIMTYQEAILQETLPKSVIIIGAGAIGVEFATIWNAYGVEVSIVEMLPQILPLEDAEAAVEVAKAFTKRGITIYTGHKVEKVNSVDSGVQVAISNNGEIKELTAEQVLVAIGFKPNTKGIGLEEVGIKTSATGFIEINEKMATNINGIWAIGDVTGKLMLAHVGSAMGIICAESISNHTTRVLDYQMMPRATYCFPQVASFGYSEAKAKEAGFSVKISKFPFQANGKALGLGDYAGWIKLIVDEKYGELLGATLVGPEVTELLSELTLAQMMELTTTEISRNIHAHPTLSEVIQEAAHIQEGTPIHL